MNELYYETLANSSNGMALFMSSLASETSLEIPNLQHGLFTYYYIKGLGGEADTEYDKIIEIQELYEYVQLEVSNEARRRGRKQTPQIKGYFDHNMPVGVTN